MTRVCQQSTDCMVAHNDPSSDTSSKYILNCIYSGLVIQVSSQLSCPPLLRYFLSSSRQFESWQRAQDVQNWSMKKARGQLSNWQGEELMDYQVYTSNAQKLLLPKQMTRVLSAVVQPPILTRLMFMLRLVKGLQARAGAEGVVVEGEARYRRSRSVRSQALSVIASIISIYLYLLFISITPKSILTIFWHTMLLPLMLTLALSLTLTSSASPSAPLDYTYLRSLQTAEAFTWLHVTGDNSRVIFYRAIDSSPIVFDAYFWQPVKNFLAYAFPNAERIVYFLDADNNSCAIYGTSNKDIKIRKYSKTDPETYEDRVIHNSNCGSYYDNLAISTDGTLWAATCSDRDSFFIGKVQDPPGSAFKVVIHPGTQSSEVVWRPNLHEVVVTGYDPIKKTNYLALVDASTQEYLELDVSNYTIYRPSFSASGRLVFMDFNKTDQTGIVKSYNFTSGKIQTWELGVEADYPSARGNYFSINVYIRGQGRFLYYYDMEADSFTLQNYAFRANTSYHYNSGETHESSFAYAVSPLGSAITDVYKICSTDGYFYNAQTNACQQCDQSCVACLYHSTTCLGCYNQSYYYVESNRSCPACSVAIENCYTCRNRSVCESCFQRYFLKGNACQMCEEKMEGCRVCTGQNTCTGCFQTYFLDNSVCSHCYDPMPGCKRCSAKSNCTECQPTYAINNQGSCSKCSQLMEGCLNCPSKQVCSECVKSYAINDNNTCSLCSELMEGCLTCKNKDLCSECGESYALNGEGGCSRCGELMEGCVNCTERDACVECGQGYAVNVAGTCSHCSDLIQGCVQCQSAQKCNTCSQSYILDPLTSICAKQQTPLTLYLILGGALLAVIVIATIVIVRCRRSRKNKLKGSSIQSDDQGGYLIPE